MERNGRTPKTVQTIAKTLKRLAKTCNLNNPEEVKAEIARYIKNNGRLPTNNYRNKMAEAYNRYCNYYQIEWEKPHYTKEDRAIIPPTKQRIEMLIASAKNPMSLKLDISYRTGYRPIEIAGNKGLTVRDFDPTQKTLTARITKGCNARPPAKIGDQLTTRLQAYIQEHNLKSDDLLFPSDSSDRYTNAFIKFKKRLAQKLNDPTIANIRLYDIRHAYTTRKLLQYNNAETVRIIMGHKCLNTTQRYLHLLNLEDGEWIVEGTTDKKRVQELLEQDYTYQLTTPEGTMMFKKRKT